MKEIIKNISRILLVLSLLPIISGCNNEDDVAEIFTGKTWKLSRLTNKDSKAQFYPGLWDNDKDMEESLKKLYDQESTFTLTFEGEELDGELIGARVSGQGIGASVDGTWSADGKSKEVTLTIQVSGSESDALGKAFINGLRNIYKYEGDVNSLTLYFKDGERTRVMGFSRK